jgi:hypothetical protein
MRNTTSDIQFPGLDLMSVDLARGRDVGLPTYNRVRHLCGLPLADDFENLVDLIHLKVINYLMTFHKNIKRVPYLLISPFTVLYKKKQHY